VFSLDGFHLLEVIHFHSVFKIISHIFQKKSLFWFSPGSNLNVFACVYLCLCVCLCVFNNVLVLDILIYQVIGLLAVAGT